MKAYPSYCCQKCGETIGWLGRFLEKIYGDSHNCEKQEK